jgi:N-acetylneuraminate synthase
MAKKMKQVKTIKIGDKLIGENQPAFIIAEIGINHNGSIEIAKEMIDMAAKCGCDAVKFQKRNPDVCVPEHQKKTMLETPWGNISYLEYRYKMEFDENGYKIIDQYCRKKGIIWFASCWDEDSVNFMEEFDPPCYKIASASLTDDDLLRHTRSKGKPIILSTGMSDMPMIEHAVDILGRENLALLHCTSAYPQELKFIDNDPGLSMVNLEGINTLRKKFGVPVGFSSHDTGIMPSYAAAVMGACVIEKHITLYRAMWGSNQAASLEPENLERLCRLIK